MNGSVDDSSRSPIPLAARTMNAAHRACRALAVASVAAGLAALNACSQPAPDAPPAVLLFSGTGTSANDVAAVEAQLQQMRIAYASVSSAELQRMTTAHLRQFRLMIVPGGNFLTMGETLTPTTAASVHDAVLSGLNYLGICAGAFLAGQASYPSFSLTSGVHFEFYAAARDGTRRTNVSISTPDAPPLDQYWEDGPQLLGWGDVVARYPDLTPAVVQGRSGRGWVILSGIHAEAPESWRRGMHFATPASADNAYARTLIDAALRGISLPHF